MTRPRLLSRVTLALCLSMAASSVAHAQQDVIKQAEKLNKTAMEDYDSLEFDSARTTLLSAISKLRDAGQDDTPTAAKIYTNLGIVYVAGFKDKNRGVQQFINALKIDGTINLDPERATPELQDAFSEAQKQAPPSTKPPSTNTNTPPANNVTGLQHVAVDEAKAGLDVPIKAQLGSDVAASRLFLFYRVAGQEEYVSVPMNVNAQGDWVGVIPGEAMEGKAVQYYVEARNARGRPVLSAGTAASPYIISVLENKGEVETPPLGDDKPKPKTPKGKDAAEEKSRGWGRLFLNVMLGTSLGVEVSGNVTEVAYQFQASTMRYTRQAIDGTGTVIEPLHLDFELGVNITKHFGLSAVVRTGFTLTNNADSSNVANAPLGYGTSKANGDFSAMLRARYMFLENKVRPFLHLGIGGGSIRHVLDISGAEDSMHPLADATTAQTYANGVPDPLPSRNGVVQVNEVCVDHNNCVDSVVMGFMFISVGGGLYIDLTQFHNGGVGIIMDLDAIIALPVGGGQTGLNFDFQVGLGAHFL